MKTKNTVRRVLAYPTRALRAVLKEHPELVNKMDFDYIARVPDSNMRTLTDTETKLLAFFPKYKTGVVLILGENITLRLVRHHVYDITLREWYGKHECVPKIIQNWLRPFSHNKGWITFFT